MRVVQSSIPDVLIIEPDVFNDERGYFFESYNLHKFKNDGISVDFVQDNQSLSQKNVLRGLHFQNPPHDQAKLVRVVKGAVLDVVVDIRLSSPYYGKHFKTILSEKNKTSIFIPPGFAHGFLTLEDDTVFFYKCSKLYNKQSEGSLLWCDENLNIDWNSSNPIVSEKDKIASKFSVFQSQFK